MRAFGRPRILVVDDEQKIRQACERALVRGGYDVVKAAGGEDALALLERESFDAVLVDVRMPGIDGPELLARCRRHDPDAPCVIMSAYADFDAVVELLRQGAREFVHKPFDANGLVTAVDRALATTHLQVDSALLAATQTIFSSLDSTETLRRVLGVVKTLVRATPAAFVMTEGGAVVHRLGPEGLVSHAARLDDGARRLLGRREALVLTAASDGEGGLVEALAPGAAEVIVQRLAVGERTLGLLCASRSPGERRFGDRCLRRLMTLAGLVALALDNARLHADAKEQTRRLDEALDRLVASERVGTVARLASGLGHEIANPASAALAHLEIAAQQVGDGQAADAGKAIQRASLAVGAILDVCEALGPLGAGRRASDIDVREVIEGAVLLASYELRPRAEVVLDLPPRLPLLRGDPGKLSQVILNLLLNAAQALPPNGSSEADHQVTVRVAVVGDALRIEVADTGPGVAPDVADRLFQPGATSKAAEGGQGMGLAVCRWIVEDLGGAIRLVEKEGPGATFELTLPLVAEDVTSLGILAAPG
jgi:signal transduction histidine kinase/CheY-like chemotaxis protein